MDVNTIKTARIRQYKKVSNIREASNMQQRCQQHQQELTTRTLATAAETRDKEHHRRKQQKGSPVSMTPAIICRCCHETVATLSVCLPLNPFLFFKNKRLFILTESFSTLEKNALISCQSNPASASGSVRYTADQCSRISPVLYLSPCYVKYNSKKADPFSS